jgi:rhodanese-related sulfurtransferase
MHNMMRGPTFYQLHLLLDKHAAEQLELIDPMGERVQTLGGVAVADPRHVAEITTVPKPPDGVEEVAAMLSRLLEAHEIVIGKAREAISKTAGRDDGTNDLLIRAMAIGLIMRVSVHPLHLTTLLPAAKHAMSRARTMPTIDDLLGQARRRLDRVTAEQAANEQANGALLVDSRTAEQRALGGEIPGALVIDRTVIEWRLDPTSPSRIPEATDHEVRVIVICAEGYSSSLAAASLHDLGLVNTTDVIGGFRAWEEAGLPVRR